MNNYLKFVKKCIRGEIPYQKIFYVLDNRYDISNDIKDKNLDVTVVTPTQQAVEHAISEVRHELSIELKRKIDQTGGRGDENKNKKKKIKRKKEKQKEIIRTKRKKGRGEKSCNKTKRTEENENLNIIQRNMDVVQASVSIFAPPPIDNLITKEY